MDRLTILQDTQESRIQAMVQQALGECMKAFDERFAKIPGVPQPIEKETLDGYEDSPFVESIARVKIPKKFHLPNVTSYDEM